MEELARVGHTKFSNLDVGFEAWEAAGYPLLQPTNSERRSGEASRSQ